MMRKKIRWFFIIVILEIALVFLLTWKTTFPITDKNSLSLCFLVPLFAIGLSFLTFFVLTFFKTQTTDSILTAVFKENRTILVIFLIIISFLLLSSAFIFITADIAIPQVYERFSIILVNLIDPQLISYLFPYAILGYVLFWEILILFSYTRDEFMGKPKYWISLPLLLAANYFLRHTLEEAGLYLEPYFFKVWKNRAEYVFSNYRWWQLLLPIKEFDGYWFFGNILTHFMSGIISISGVWYLNQAILMVTAFFLSWKVFKSDIFSYTLAICLGFGTHFYNAFQYSSIASLYLLQTLFILLLYLAYEYIRREKGNLGYLYALIPVLLFTAIFYEGWLDFFSAVWATSIFLFFYFRNKKQNQYIKRLSTVFIIFNLVAALYIYLKFTYVGFSHSTGESAVVFSYSRSYAWRAVEDMISNYFTQLYMTLTNFFPPAFVTSNALYQYSDDLQERSNLILRHYTFFWRYAAGILSTLFFVFFFKVVKRLFKEKPFSALFPLTLFMIMVMVNSPTHTMIQFRPMKSMPVLGYYIHQGILGISLCIAYLFYLFKLKSENKRIVRLVFIGVVLIILWGSVRRPNYLWHMIKMVGLERQGPFPNPYYTILENIRKVLPGFLNH